MYNVKVKRFLHDEQVQVFSEYMVESLDIEELRYAKGEIDYNGNVIPYNVSKETGEVFPYNSHHWINIYTGEEDYYYNMGDYIENRKRSCRRTKNVVYDIAKSNEWEWFVTLTFNPEKVDSYNYAVVTKKLSYWLNNMRKKCKDMVYVVVPELHKSGRWHFHGLFASCDEMNFVESGCVDERGRMIYNVGAYRLGFTTATKIEHLESCVHYLAKYITKDVVEYTHGLKRYWCSRNVKRPIIETYFCSYRSKELERIRDIGKTRKVCSEYVDVEYISVPIYTTNISRLVTSE